MTATEAHSDHDVVDPNHADWAPETRRIERFLYRYVHVLDQGDFASWPEFFLEDGSYALTTQENVHGKGMSLFVDRGSEALKERAAYALGYWLAPARKTTHVVTNVYVIDVSDDLATTHANVVLYRVNRRGESLLHVVGEYCDVVSLADSAVRFVSHQVVLDGSLLPSDMTSIL
jgi:3-phenylpropionate/cinnamic acid dioxygenase small subunit